MQKIGEYYKVKSKLEVPDVAHERITEGDVDLLRKASALLLVTPFLGVALMVLFRDLRSRLAMSTNFMQNIRSAQERVTGIETYGRIADAQTPEFENAGQAADEAAKLRGLYEEIKKEQPTRREVRTARPTGQRILNSSPFHQGMQAKRFGIDHSSRLSYTAKEKSAELRA